MTCSCDFGLKLWGFHYVKHQRTEGKHEEFLLEDEIEVSKKISYEKIKELDKWNKTTLEKSKNLTEIITKQVLFFRKEIREEKLAINNAIHSNDLLLLKKYQNSSNSIKICKDKLENLLNSIEYSDFIIGEKKYIKKRKELLACPEQLERDFNASLLKLDDYISRLNNVSSPRIELIEFVEKQAIKYSKMLKAYNDNCKKSSNSGISIESKINYNINRTPIQVISETNQFCKSFLEMFSHFDYYIKNTGRIYEIKTTNDKKYFFLCKKNSDCSSNNYAGRKN